LIEHHVVTQYRSFMNHQADGAMWQAQPLADAYGSGQLHAEQL